MNATPPPGWYPDNVGSGQRYWDGLASPYGEQFTLEDATYAVNKVGL